MRVRLDPKVCKGGARCWENVPLVFGSDERGRAVLKQAEVPDDPALRADVAWAVNACPTGALAIEDA
jgi:ferredoxin